MRRRVVKRGGRRVRFSDARTHACTGTGADVRIDTDTDTDTNSNSNSNTNSNSVSVSNSGSGSSAVRHDFVGRSRIDRLGHSAQHRAAERKVERPGHVHLLAGSGNEAQGRKSVTVGHVQAAGRDPICGVHRAVVETACTMTERSSAGPWMRQHADGNSVHALVHGEGCGSAAYGKIIDGPRFTRDNLVPLCRKADC